MGEFQGTMRRKKTYVIINICKTSSSRNLHTETTMRYVLCFIPTRKKQIKKLD